MIYYNSNTINDWSFGDDNIIKVYRNGALVYYKVTTSGGTPEYKVCYAVVDDISQYSETEFEDVYDKATEKWYKLNNLNEYEEYGIYGSGRTECSGSSRLPDGYTEVEYVENSGTSALNGAYIDTGIYLNTSNFEVGCEVVDTYCFWGYCHQNVVNGTWLGIESTTSHQTAFYGKFNSSDINNISSYLSSVENTIVYTQSGVTVNGSVLSNSLTMGRDNIANKSLVFFGRYDFNANSVEWQTNSKFKSFYVKNNGTLVRDFVPAKRDSDNKYGMYDLITDTFYLSPNNVDFSGGDPITPTDCVTTYNGKLTIDDGYEYEWNGSSWVNVGEVSGSSRVEYIERNSTHSGYLPLGEYFTENTVIDIDFQMTQAKGNAIIGDYGSNDNDDWRIFFNYDSQVNNWLIYDFINSRNYYNTGDWSKRFNLEIGNYYIKDLNTGTYLVNATRKTSFTRPNQMYLFHMEGSQITNNIDYGYIYSVKIYQNNELVRDFVPWTDGNGNYGLYDNVSSSVTQSIGLMTGYSISVDVYPKYYSEKSEPLDNLTFNTMAEAQTYAEANCVYVGLNATINGDKYVFSGDSQSGYEWVEITLPYDAQVEYLESTGTQYINTNIYLNTSSFEIGYNILGNRVKWGYTHQGSGAGTWIAVEASTAFFGSYNNGRVSITTDNTENVVTFASTSGITVNGVSYSKTFQLGSDSIASRPLYFFAMYDFRNGMDYDSSGKVKSFYIKNNGVLVLDMIPVRVGQVGYMYDRVSGQLFSNAGTGQFILGPDV